MTPPSQSEGTTSQTTEMEPKKRPVMPADLFIAVMKGNRDVLEQRLGLAEEDPNHVKVQIEASDPPAPQQTATKNHSLESELQSATRYGNTILHVLVANNRHNDNELALKVFQKDPTLLTAANKKMETPLHSAAKFGNVEVIESLNKCAPDLVKSVVNKTNDNGDTALHLAAKHGQKKAVRKLMTIDREMVYEFNKEGSSPLHMAIANARDDKIDDMLQIMLNVDPSAAWTQFADGTFPIHVATRIGKAKIVAQFMSRDSERASTLLDPDGRNLFHIAAANDQSDIIWQAYADLFRHLEDDGRRKEIINAKDCEGNTPLHIAAMMGNAEAVLRLNKSDDVDKTTLNNKDMTAFRMSAIDQLKKLTQMRQRVKMYDYMRREGHKFTEEWYDLGKEPTPEELAERGKIAERTQVIGLGSVLITTVAFAAAFTFPGGYNADNGTPILGRRYMFRAFMLANALAFVQSSASIFLLIKNYFSSEDRSNPQKLIISAALLFLSAATTMVKAFGIGSYVMLAPVNLPIAIIILILGVLFGSSIGISYFGHLVRGLPNWFSGYYNIAKDVTLENYNSASSSFLKFIDRAVYLAMWAVRHGWPLLIIFGVAFLK